MEGKGGTRGVVFLLVAIGGILLLYVGYTRWEQQRLIRRVSDAPGSSTVHESSEATSTGPVPEAVPAPPEPAAVPGRAVDEIETMTPEEAKRLEALDRMAYESGRTTPEPLRPQWNVGQWWEVDTYYRQMQAVTDHWSKTPRRWRYEVTGQGMKGEEPIFELHVTTDEYVARVLVRARDYQVIGIQEEGKEREFSGGVTTIPFSRVPFEMIPAGTEGRQLASTLGRPLPDPFVSDPSVAIPRASGTVIDAKYEQDGEELTQRWDPSHPVWPLFTRSKTRLSYLRKVSR